MFSAALKELLPKNADQSERWHWFVNNSLIKPRRTFTSNNLTNRPIKGNLSFFRHPLVPHLLKDFSLLLKVLKLIMAIVCLHEVSKYNEYSVPRWLWVIYCINTSTYSIIYISIGLVQIFEIPRRLPELVSFALGVILNLIGAIAGIERSRNATSLDAEVNRSELKIGLLLLANFIVLFFETAHMIYVEVTSKSEIIKPRASSVEETE